MNLITSKKMSLHEILLMNKERGKGIVIMITIGSGYEKGHERQILIKFSTISIFYVQLVWNLKALLEWTIFDPHGSMNVWIVNRIDVTNNKYFLRFFFLKLNLNHWKLAGTRLISTRRPVTPREPKRQLYGKTSLAGRPPSAFR